MSLESLEKQFHIIINQEEALVDDIFLQEPVEENTQFWFDLNNNPLNQQPEIPLSF